MENYSTDEKNNAAYFSHYDVIIWVHLGSSKMEAVFQSLTLKSDPRPHRKGKAGSMWPKVIGCTKTNPEAHAPRETKNRFTNSWYYMVTFSEHLNSPFYFQVGSTQKAKSRTIKSR